MKQSDIISAFIKDLLESQNGIIELGRNELAQRFNVVPSQINYVITSRFTPEHGYIIESRRGGGGYIRIRQVEYSDKNAQIMHIINSIGKTLTNLDAALFLKNMEDNGYITLQTHRLIRAATSDNALSVVSPSERDEVRASILKNILLVLKG
ncbi:MAG: CtsR family transcriptional regulator [Clostridiales bacterium]|nr:MAG: CtsR family transcriptional regulator [Clostridiales bacterium]